MADRFRVRCDAVKYRQGFIEVIGQIHPGLVNVETWQVTVEADITGRGMECDSLTDADFVANTELELTLAQARSLAAALVAAADAAEGGALMPNQALQQTGGHDSVSRFNGSPAPPTAKLDRSATEAVRGITWATRR